MQSVRINPVFLLVGLIIPVLLLLFLIKFSKILWIIGMFCAPVLLAIAYFINKKPILDHLAMLGATLRTDLIKGLFYTVFSAVGLPFLALFFVGKAFVINKIETLKQDPNGFANAFFGENDAISTQKNEEYAEYEEIETIVKE